MTRLSDDSIWASIAETLRDVVIPGLPDGHRRLAAIQLAALADHARTRGADPAADREAELAQLLGHDFPGPGSSLEQSAALLSATAGARATSGASSEIAARVRAALVRHLEEDLASTAALGDAFRGKLPAGSPDG